MCFLRHEIESEDIIRLAREGFGKDRGSSAIRKDCHKSVHKDEPTAATLISSTTGAKLSCSFCDSPHLSQDGQKLSDMSYEDRKSQVIRKRCCLVCLKVGHLAKECHSRVRCLICKRRHYPLLCPDLRKEKETNFSSKDRTTDNEWKSTETLLANLPSEHEIYLKTIMIRLRNRDKKVCVRELLDDGSQRSYIEKNLAAEPFLSPSGREIFSQGPFGGGIFPASEHKRYVVNVESLNHKYATSLSLFEQQKICSTLPRIHDRKLLSELASRGIKLTDVGRDSLPIRVLLGADILGSILTGRIGVISSGVSAVETLLGWTILGLGKKRKVVNLVTLSLQNMDVPKMWDSEVLGIIDPIEKKNERLLEEETLPHFKETIRICEGQRYEVALPWLAGHPALYDKYDAAEYRLCTATKRLINENYFEAYDNVFKQWESEGIIEAVPIDQLAKEVHYLPHRPVIKPSSNTTKVHPVSDASFKKPGFASLNECLSVGPSLIHKILPLLLRFRFGAIGVIADMEQAFLQIRWRTNDIGVLRFLWRELKNENLSSLSSSLRRFFQPFSVECHYKLPSRTRKIPDREPQEDNWSFKRKTLRG
ncbi:integrase catalytic domain-containing protein [Trichonephila clavipes]|uniref:Integrase catalytic domain-containing protein n=1 Tax=Trichonephila clavipes TaxID=2585209 RepID=A0A8X6RPV6_TRICX|nr:integrase catalytic domain-containing protein [Trichonephila clavipes]